MLSGEEFHMSRLIRKISTVILACLLGFNLAAYAAVVTLPCQSSICANGLMDMGHCDGLLDFGFPMQGCCDECGDIFCDLLKNSLQDINAVNSSSFQGNYDPFLLESTDVPGESSLQIALSEPGYLFTASVEGSQLPLYIQHLALII
jgi:hypothetical protein